jgi:hypothetical protein
MHQIITIAAGVALGIIVAAGLIFILYHNRQAFSNGSIAVRQWAWRSGPWFAGAAVLALTVFLFIDAKEERNRKYLEQLRQQEQQESWRHAEEMRKRVRAECDAAEKWIEEQCQ